MKILLCAGGTRGDVQPVVALSLALINAGHQVRLAAPPENRRWVESYGIPFAALSLNVEEMVEELSSDMTITDLVKFLRLLKKGIETQLLDFPPLVEGCDLAIGISLVFGLKTAAEYHRVPYLFLGTSPQVLPSGRHPTIAMKNQKLPRFLNRLDWWTAGQFNALTWLRTVNRERRRLGLPTYNGSVWNHFLEPMTLIISDEELAPVPSDVAVDYRVMGHLPLKQLGRLGPDVESFLAQGPPPVYIGFGSMPERVEETSRMVLEAARTCGRRLIVGSGLARLTDLDPGRDHLVVGSLPHDQLFPHMAAVVHHGGAGTTATAARAGVPQIITPHYFDQFYWAERIIQAGLGPRAPVRKRLDSTTLARAIDECLSKPDYSIAAKEMADALSRKDALKRTVDYIEANYSSVRRLTTPCSDNGGQAPA